MPGKLTLTIGLPGSGKSTWAKAQKDAQRMERDMIRYALTGDRRDHSREGEVTRLHREGVRSMLDAGMHVIVSDTNLRARYRKQWRTLAEEVGADYDEVSFMDVPVETCIERDALRPDPVGQDIIKKMHETWRHG
jgi:predicted kinase